MLAKKEAMTQIFDEAGKMRPATILSAGPLTVTKKGENSYQVGYGEKKASRVNKAQRYLSPKEGFGFAVIRSVKSPVESAVGGVIDISIFAPGDKVKVSAVSKGKGFQGVVKRHGFKGGPRTHGQKHSEREAGSIGATGPQRVFKGLRMPGRMGGDRVTVSNLEVLQVNPETKQLLIAGAIPGRRGTLVEITG
ncbi:MAG: 50S ribosomal protein L3 [bacterium]|nr:50S ribosomal protein L3 [bacterium]